MAAAGQDVVIVGCDLRKPRLHEFFGASNDVGFTSVMLGEAELDDALQDVPGSAHLKLLPAGPIPPNPSELLASRPASSIMQALGQRFDLIIIDSPPLLPVSDASVLAGSADAVILVAAAGISTKRNAGRSMELLLQVGADIRGTILNRAATGMGPQVRLRRQMDQAVKLLLPTVPMQSPRDKGPVSLRPMRSPRPRKRPAIEGSSGAEMDPQTIPQRASEPSEDDLASL